MNVTSYYTDTDRSRVLKVMDIKTNVCKYYFRVDNEAPNRALNFMNNDLVLYKNDFPRYNRYVTRRNAIVRYQERPINQKKFFIKREIRVTRSVLLSIIMFFLAWSPHAIVMVFAQYGTNIEQYVTPYSTAFAALFTKISHLSNPLIYTLMNKDCREYFTRFFSMKHIPRHMRNSIFNL